MFISVLNMFRATMCPSSGELIVSIHLVHVTLYRWPFGVQVWMRLIQTCAPNGHLYRVTYTRCHIDTIDLTHNSFSCMFISILYMFRAAMCPSLRELIVSIRHLVYVTLYRWPFGVQVWMSRSLIQTCAPNGHIYRVTYIICRIDTVDFPSGFWTSSLYSS